MFIGDKIKQLQGSESHKGKHPKFQSCSERQRQEEIEADLGKMDENGNLKEDPNAAVWDQIARLNLQLKEALKKEDYERAAQCRDQIRALRKEVEAHE